MTVVMKIDLVGPQRRGLALGLNESAGYGGVALAAGLSGLLAAEFAARDVLVVAGGSSRSRPSWCRCSSSATRPRTSRSSRPRTHGADGRPRRCARPSPARPTASLRCARARRPASSTTSTTPWPGASCRSSSPPTAPACQHRPRRRPVPGGVGPGPDRHRALVRPRRAQAADRRGHAAPGRRARPAGASDGALAVAAVAAAALGLGTALVYPTLIAAISDAVSPVARAPMVGVYRFWRDMGYVLGGLIAGVAADSSATAGRSASSRR